MTVSVEMTRLLENVRMHTPGALDDAIKLEIFNALDDFFRQSHCWLQDISVSAVAGDDTYTLTPTADTGTILDLVSLTGEADQPVGATMPTPGELVLDSEPSSNETLTAKVSLTVVEPLDADDLPNIPTWFMKKYGIYLLDGVLGRMFSQPVKPYTNERMAIYHTRKFRGGIAVARSEARPENLYAGQRWRYPRFA
jgi:hypothetical protein